MTEEKKHFLDTKDFGLLGLARYRGCIVRKLGEGKYTIWDRGVMSAEEIDIAIDEALNVIDKSIK